MENKLTPMQELINMMHVSVKQYEGNAQQESIFYAIIEEAKKQLPKEKQMIIESYANGCHRESPTNYVEGEQYYNDTFNKK